jgi:hypothetical protein
MSNMFWWKGAELDTDRPLISWVQHKRLAWVDKKTEFN